MKAPLCAAVVGLLCLAGSSFAKDAPPKVQVYSHGPGEFKKVNTLLCHVSGFHPPEITIQLLKNGKEMHDSKQTDLSFEENWQYHLTKHAPFTPNQGEHFSCKVTHMGKSKTYNWEPDM
ncbi:beta-2-microglobulin-like [Brachyistius frenatus]|uniref:beta-2-microglobulin-like n=1 Tax=Brachyistius frenatus TaxID=100188 RepID=UPI0037E832C6